MFGKLSLKEFFSNQSALKLFFCNTLVLIGIFSAVIYITISVFEDETTNSAKIESNLISQMILDSAYLALVTEDDDLLESHIKPFLNERFISSIRVLKENEVLYSSKSILMESKETDNHYFFRFEKELKTDRDIPVIFEIWFSKEFHKSSHQKVFYTVLTLMFISIGLILAVGMITVYNFYMPFKRIKDYVLNFGTNRSQYDSKDMQIPYDDIKDQSIQSAIMKINFLFEQVSTEEDRLQRKIDIQTDKLNQKAKELEVSLFKVQKLLKAKSDFLANLSHEIRTPLNSIIANSEIMLNTDDISREQCFDLRLKILEQAESVTEMINSVLEFSSIENIDLKNEPVQVSLRSLLSAQYNTHSAYARKHHLNFVIDFDQDNDYIISIDEKKVMSILTNLINNSIKYVDIGEVHLKVRLHEDYIDFFVEDNGNGIDEKYVADIFKPFTQGADVLRKGSAHKGVGLGLAIVEKYTHAINGTVIVNSNSKEGLSVRVRIPVDSIVKVQSVRNSGILKLFDENQGILSVNKKDDLKIEGINDLKILIVDDNKDNVDGCEGYLKILGSNNFSSVFNGTDALAAMSDSYYDIVLLDIQMPDISGIDVAKKLHERKDRKNFNIIGVTAYSEYLEAWKSNEEHDGMSMQEFFDGIIVKPYKIVTLRDKIKDIIDEKKRV